MTQSEILIQEAISAYRLQVNLLEKRLCSTDGQENIQLKLVELGNGDNLSLESLKENVDKIQQKIDKLILLNQKINKLFKFGQKINDESTLLYFIKFNFLLKEIVSIDLEFLNSQLIKLLIDIYVPFYKKVQNIDKIEGSNKDNIHIILEVLKHVLKILFDIGLQKEVFSESGIIAFDLGDITPQESETVLIFLSTMKKWEPVYKRLAAV